MAERAVRFLPDGQLQPVASQFQRRLVILGNQCLGIGGLQQGGIGQYVGSLGIGGNGFIDLAAFKVNLPHQFVKIGILWLLGDQPVESFQCTAYIIGAPQGHGAGILGGDRLVTGWEPLESDAREQVSAQLGLHPGKAFGHFRADLDLLGAVLGDIGPDCLHSIAGERVSAGIFDLSVGWQQILLSETFHEPQETMGALAGCGKETHPGGVGRCLLCPAEAEDRAIGDFLTAGNDRCTDVTAPCTNCGGNAEQGGENRLCRSALHCPAQPDQVATGNVAGFVGHHADHFLCRSRLKQQAGMEEHIQPLCDKGIEGIILNDSNAYRLGADTGSGEDRRCHIIEQAFGFSVPEQLCPTLGKGLTWISHRAYRQGEDKQGTNNQTTAIGRCNAATIAQGTGQQFAQGFFQRPINQNVQSSFHETIPYR